MKEKCLLITNMCYAIKRPMSTFWCQDCNKVIKNIVKLSKQFDYCFLVNDEHHEEDTEFNYLPPHCIVGSVDCTRLTKYERQIKSKYFQFLKKNTLSAIYNKHNRKLISQFKSVHLAGFIASFDILSTTLDLVNRGQNCVLYKSCISDMVPQRKQMTFNQLGWLGCTIND